ncbi:heavy-metal-associated domain-containing protein [Pseudotenacibaculum sp. MALMAid0570]|uniref:heavy-metal-associated domain-containing protein n=1 Tax=Pseudotenacibaculum sp. MALMAid0570 TaxID=3143938 RepID=UPI0032DE325D
MKKILVIIAFMLIGMSAQAQKKNAKVSIEVDGVCMMCKKRIEKAALSTKGVKFAVWNVNTHMLSLIIDERKTNVKTIQKKMASVGHDTKAVKASDEAYNSVDPCCKYRDQKVVDAHKKGDGH